MNVNKTLGSTTAGLKSTVSDTTTAAGQGDIGGTVGGATGGLGKTVSGAGRGLVSHTVTDTATLD
jgi:hypothetical protein